MTTTTPRPSKRPPQAKKSPQRGVNASIQKQRRTRALWIGAAIVAVVALAGITAVVAGSGGGGRGGDVTLKQIQPVEVSGTPLPTFDRTAAVDPAIGMDAPDLKGLSFGDTPISIKPGEPTMLVFMAHWCPHCQAEIPRLVQWHHSGQTPEKLNIVGVVTGTDPNQPNYPPSSWLVREEWPWPVLVDDAASSAMAAYGLSTYPGFVLIDADGKVVYRATGELPMEDVDAAITSKLGL